MYNTRMHEAFGSCLRNKNGKLQDDFSFRLAEEEIALHFPCFFQKVPNSNYCLHVIPQVTLLLPSLKAAVGILKLYSSITPRNRLQTCTKQQQFLCMDRIGRPCPVQGSLLSRHLHYPPPPGPSIFPQPLPST